MNENVTPQNSSQNSEQPVDVSRPSVPSESTTKPAAPTADRWTDTSMDVPEYTEGASKASTGRAPQSQNFSSFSARSASSKGTNNGIQPSSVSSSMRAAKEAVTKQFQTTYSRSSDSSNTEERTSPAGAQSAVEATQSTSSQPSQQQSSTGKESTHPTRQPHAGRPHGLKPVKKAMAQGSSSTEGMSSAQQGIYALAGRAQPQRIDPRTPVVSPSVASPSEEKTARMNFSPAEGSSHSQSVPQSQKPIAPKAPQKTTIPGAVQNTSTQRFTSAAQKTPSTDQPTAKQPTIQQKRTSTIESAVQPRPNISTSQKSTQPSANVEQTVPVSVAQPPSTNLVEPQGTETPSHAPTRPVSAKAVPSVPAPGSQQQHSPQQSQKQNQNPVHSSAGQNPSGGKIGQNAEQKRNPEKNENTAALNTEQNQSQQGVQNQRVAYSQPVNTSSAQTQSSETRPQGKKAHSPGQAQKNQAQTLPQTAQSSAVQSSHSSQPLAPAQQGSQNPKKNQSSQQPPHAPQIVVEDNYDEESYSRGTIDAGLLILRVVFGFMLLSHGIKILFGIGENTGINGLEESFAAYTAPNVLALGLPIAEIVSGGMLMLGLATPLGAALSIIASGFWMLHLREMGGMANIWDVDSMAHSWNLLALIGVVLLFTGPGYLSLDRYRSWATRPLHSTWIMLIVAVAGLAGIWLWSI